MARRTLAVFPAGWQAAAPLYWAARPSQFHRLPKIAVAKIRDDAPLTRSAISAAGHHRHSAGDQHRQGRARCKSIVFGSAVSANVIRGCGLLPAPTMIIGRRISTADKKSLGERFWHDALRQSRRRSAATPSFAASLRDQDRVRSAAPTTLSNASAMSISCAWRWRAAIAAGARASSSASPARAGDRDPAVPARHRPGMARHRFGGARGRSDVPKIVDWYMRKKIEIDPMITHTMPLGDINKAFELMRDGKSIRSVVVY